MCRVALNVNTRAAPVCTTDLDISAFVVVCDRSEEKTIFLSSQRLRCLTIDALSGELQACQACQQIGPDLLQMGQMWDF